VCVCLCDDQGETHTSSSEKNARRGKDNNRVGEIRFPGLVGNGM
jgi:hypothetical protein